MVLPSPRWMNAILPGFLPKWGKEWGSIVKSPTFCNGLHCQECDVYDAYISSSLSHRSGVTPVVITDSFSSAAVSHCLLVCFSQCDTQDSVNNSSRTAGTCAARSPPPHPTTTPLQIFSLLFNPAHAHPSNIIIHLLFLQLLWVWICQTHIHIWCVFRALALNYCTKHHHKSVCVYVRDRHQVSLK